MDKFRHLLSAHENCFQKNTPTQNIKMTCGGSGENVCAVIAVLAVFENRRNRLLILGIHSLIFRKKGCWK